MCFGTVVENKLLSSLSDDMTVDQFQEEVRKYDECFNGCSQCGCDLVDGEDGYLTSHGTCNMCTFTEEAPHAFE